MICVSAIKAAVLCQQFLIQLLAGPGDVMRSENCFQGDFFDTCVGIAGQIGIQIFLLEIAENHHRSRKDCHAIGSDGLRPVAFCESYGFFFITGAI